MLAVRSLETPLINGARAPMAATLRQPISVRDNLLLMATDRFCGTQDYDRLGVDQYKEAFYSLVSTASVSTLKKIASKLSKNAYMPREVLIYLANESTEISAPILRHAPLLGQLDMVQLVEYHDLKHARILATRPDLGRSVVKRLQQLEDDQITEILENNGALNIPVKKQDTRRRMNAVIRKSSAAEQQTHVRPKSNRTVTVSIQRSSESKNGHNGAQKSLLSAAARGGRLPESIASQPTAARAPKMFERHLDQDFAAGMEKMALTQSRQGMTVLMQKRFNLSMETCQQVLEDNTGETLAVMLKAAGINDAMANRINLLTFPDIGFSVDNARKAIKFYDGLETRSCLEAIEQWPKENVSKARHHSYLEETPKDRKRADQRPSTAHHDPFADVSSLVVNSR